MFLAPEKPPWPWLSVRALTAALGHRVPPVQPAAVAFLVEPVAVRAWRAQRLSPDKGTVRVRRSR